MQRLRVVLFVLFTAYVSTGCLVLSINPGYDQTAMAWEPNLVGQWESIDDKSAVRIDRGEWKSYRIHYDHPIEAGDLTGYLTSIADQRYLDVMPARGEDRGAFLVPVHALLRVRLDGDRLELTPLSYDWFYDQLRAQRTIPGLSVALDQKHNALIVSPSDRLRAWLRVQSLDAPAFGAPATFTRKGGNR